MLNQRKTIFKRKYSLKRKFSLKRKYYDNSRNYYFNHCYWNISSYLEDRKTLTPSKAQSFLNIALILGMFTGLFICCVLYERIKTIEPTALDVYRDKTILNINITYQDGNIIECDSTVTFKNDSVKLSK